VQVLIRAHSTCFWLEKLGSTEREWEDAAAFHDDDPARFIVVDGATEAYDARRWVDHLVTTFVADPHQELTRAGLRGWFEQVQRLWTAEAPDRFATVIEEHKFHQEGSFATFVGCRLLDLDGPDARWEAAALGDSVLFHVRSGRLLCCFPALGVDDFGLSPDGIGTHPGGVDRMLDRVAFASHPVRDGDLLYLATDAMAQWLLRERNRDEVGLWPVLAALDHDATFAALVADQRAVGRLHNDDVTLLRVALTMAEPRALAVCR
jgi:hypothetical protein